MRSYEFVTETAQEQQIINLVSVRAAQNLLKGKTTGDNFKRAMLAPMGGYTRYLRTVMLRNLGLEDTDSPTINTLLNNIEVELSKEPHPTEPRTLGAFAHDGVIIVYAPRVLRVSQVLGKDPVEVVASVIAHELQHALDFLKSKGSALQKEVPADLDSDQQMATYLRLPHEINARFSQALLDISQYNITDKSKLPQAIKAAFQKNQLEPELFGKDQTKYRRLLSRTYKFFDAHINDPYDFTPKQLAQRAWSFITRQPTDVIKRTNARPSTPDVA